MTFERFLMAKRPTRALRMALVALLGLGLLAGVAGQSLMPGSPGQELQVTDQQINGDRDSTMVAFFSIPDTVTDPIYFGIYDSQIGGANDTGTTMRTIYTLVGGTGAFTGSQSRSIDFTTDDPYADG